MKPGNFNNLDCSGLLKDAGAHSNLSKGFAAYGFVEEAEQHAELAQDSYGEYCKRCQHHVAYAGVCDGHLFT